MPTEELDQKVLALQAARLELNTLIEKFTAVKEALDDLLIKLWGIDRFFKYQQKEGIILQVGFDKSFEKYQSLDKEHKEVGDDGMTEQDLEEYQQLEARFSVYHLAIKDKDILSVKKDYADRLADIEQHAKEMMQGVEKYKVCMNEAVEIVKKEMTLTEKMVRSLERVLNLCAIVDREKLPTSEFMPRLLLSERLKIVRRMKADGLFSDYNVMNVLVANCVYVVHECFLTEYTQAEISEFTVEKVRVYQYQDTDTTQTRIIGTLKDAGSLIKGSVDNYTLVENLAAICNGTANAAEIKSKANQKLVEMLLESSGVDKHNIGKIYEILVDENGSIISSREEITATEDRFSSIQRYNQTVRLPYIIVGGTDFPYSGDNPEVTGWIIEDNNSLDRTLFELASA